MTIPIDKTVAKDLIHHRIQELDTIIKEILDKWNYDKIDDFIGDTKRGKLAESSIDDALELQNVVDKREEIAAILE